MSIYECVSVCMCKYISVSLCLYECMYECISMYMCVCECDYMSVFVKSVCACYTWCLAVLLILLVAAYYVLSTECYKNVDDRAMIS